MNRSSMGPCVQYRIMELIPVSLPPSDINKPRSCTQQRGLKPLEMTELGYQDGEQSA